MKGRTKVIFYVLSAYVIVQFIWWGYHMIDLTNETSGETSLVAKRVTMVLGEGAVFLLILLVGIWQIRRSIKRDLKLNERQNNFLLSVTHELKTPLAANKLYIQTVKKRDLEKEQVNQLLDKAIEENDRLERMIDNILNASRLENNALVLSKEMVNLNQLSGQIVDRFKSISGAKYLVNSVDENIELKADKMMIETLLNNLIENAIKYCGTETKIEVYGTQNGSTIKWGVRDEGNGIPAEHQQDIFRKFFRIGDENTRTQKGSGLGLYIVSQLSKLHGWTIQYRNNQPKGANFEITLQNG